MSIAPTYQDLENHISELKKQNEILQTINSSNCKEKYHALFSNMNEGFASCQMIYSNNEPIDFLYLEVNNAFEKLTGLKNVVGCQVSKLIPNHTIDNQELFNLYTRVSNTGISEKTETFVASLNKWFSISVYSTKKGQFLVIFDNITQRKNHEAELLMNEALFQALFEKSHVGFTFVGLDKRFIRVNKAFCDFLGYSEKEIIGKNIIDFTHPDDVEIGIHQLQQFISGTNRYIKVSKRYLKKDGTIAWGEIIMSLIKDEQNTPCYFLAIIFDITERHTAELALKTSESRFQELIKNSFDIIVLMDADGIQQYVSKSCENILGFKQKELIGIPIIEKMIHPEDQEKVTEGFLEIVKNNAHGGVRYRHLHKNGKWIYLEAYGNNQLNNKEINAIVLNIRNVSEQVLAEKTIKESELKLKQLNSTKDKLFSIIAHDLRSPFNSIIGFSELLMTNDYDNDVEKTKKFAGYIHSSAKNTLVLLDNLLHWARSQTNQLTFNPKKINLFSLISEVINESQSRALLKNITINHIQAENIDIYADVTMVSIILRNLISNATKFTNIGGIIKVIANTTKNQVEITVADNGIGMNSEKTKTLFNIASNTTTLGTANEKGNGLGLLLCKEFVERHDGTMMVESQEGKGSSFKFTLPLFS